MNHAFRSTIFSSALIITSGTIVTKASATLTLDELSYLGSGTPRGYKLAAQQIKPFGSYDAWVDSKGNCERYKDKLDPHANNMDEAIEHVKEELAGTADTSLLDDAIDVSNKLSDLRNQINQLDAEQLRLQGIIDQLTQENADLEGAFTNAKNDIDPSKDSILESIESILDKPQNYTTAWQSAHDANPDAHLVDGAITAEGRPKPASMRNELIILFNILKDLNINKPIVHIATGQNASSNNVTLADIIWSFTQP